MSHKCKYDATKNSSSVAVSGEDSSHRTPHATLICSVNNLNTDYRTLDWRISVLGGYSFVVSGKHSIQALLGNHCNTALHAGLFSACGMTATCHGQAIHHAEWQRAAPTSGMESGIIIYSHLERERERDWYYRIEWLIPLMWTSDIIRCEFRLLYSYTHSVDVGPFVSLKL